jgi:hypothetical protein
MHTFWSYLVGAVIRPRRTFGRLLEDPQRLDYGIAAILFIGALYTLTVIGFAVARADISFPAWIVIPRESYYFWEIFFALPVYLAAWILAAGLIQLLCKPCGGRGTFEEMLAVLGFAVALPSSVTWLPETVGIILILLGALTQAEWREIIARPGFWQLFSQVYQFVALAWFLLLFPLAVAAGQKVRGWQAAVVGVLTVAVTGLVVLIFIR